LEDWDVTVNTGLGTGNRERDLQMGTLVLGKMEEILQKLGMNNPIVSLPMYSQALVKMVETIGFENGEQYFKPIPADWQPPPQEEKEDPEMVKIKGQLAIQAQQAQFDREQKREDAQLQAILEQQSAKNKADIERIQAEADIATKERVAMIELGLKRAEHEQKIDLAEREADLAEKIRLKQATKPKAQNAQIQ
jgi:hypothetical protein